MAYRIEGLAYTCVRCGGRHFQICMARIEDTPMVATMCDNCGTASLLTTTPEQKAVAELIGIPNGDIPLKADA